MKAAAAGLALSVPAGLGGCAAGSGATSAAASKSGPLTVYLWDTDLIQTLVPWLHEQLPDADIQFIGGNNDVDLYSYLLEHGELPDVITVRRFAGTEARDLRPHLLDFDAYDVVSEFSSYSLQYYKGEDGQISWLPICGIPQTIIANKTLIEQNGLQVPQSYDQYKQLCQALHDKGIKPYALDLAQDWSSHEMLQAGGIGELTSLAGITWRAQAESAQADISFDKGLWGQIISHTATLLADSHLTQEDLSVDTAAAMKLFVEGKAAMFHGSPSHLRQCRAQMDAELVRVSYFSQTSDEGYIYMTPSIHVAMNKELEANHEKLECATNVLRCMLSAEGQQLISGGDSVISFNPSVASITDGMAGLESEIENNQFYIRYSAQKSFSASVKAVSGLLEGTMDEAQALKAFCDAINADVAEEVVTVSFEKDYALSLNKSGGRDAASSILATVAQHYDAQLALAPYFWFASPIYAGKCTDNRVSLMVANKSNATSLYLATLTGARVKELVEHDLAGPDGDFCPICEYELPVASGMKLVVQHGGSAFALKELQVDGAPIEDEKTYSILLTDGVVAGLAGEAEAIPDVTLATVWAQAMAAGQQPSEPQDYIEVRG